MDDVRCSYKKHKKLDKRSRSHSNSRNRSRSTQNTKQSKKDRRHYEPYRHISTSSNREETNLLNFSFIDFKYELNKILQGHYYCEMLIDDTNDFWLFLKKYEALLKKAGQCILPVPCKKVQMSTVGISSAYDKTLNINIILNISFDELYARLPQTDNRRLLSQYKVNQFFDILVHYIDFKQKEKFNKLKKLRKTQQNLPVALKKTEIINAVRDNQVVILAGDTGCGKSTQVPQYLHQGGFDNVGTYFK